MGTSPTVHADSDARLRQAGSERGAGELRTLIGVKAVSYTHLDVYKRQDKGLTGERLPDGTEHIHCVLAGG